MASKVPIYSPVDASTKSGSVEYLHSVQGFPIDANRLFPDASAGNVLIRRFNKGVLRWPSPWLDKVISFNAVTSPLLNTDGSFAVVVDGVHVDTITLGSNKLYPQRYYSSNLPIAAGGSVVEVWEPDGGRDEPGLNTDVDLPFHGGFVTGVWLPPGKSITRARANTCVVMIGDSVPSSTNVAPAVIKAAIGRLRLLAFSAGVMIVSLDGGSYTLAGDGLSPLQLSNLVQQVAATTGAANVYVYAQIGRNDYRYWFDGTRANHTPAEVATFMQTAMGLLPADYVKIVSTMMPTSFDAPFGIQPNSLQDYRDALAAITGTNLTIVDGLTSGIIPGVDLYDGVHELSTPGLGVDKNLAYIRAALASVGLTI
jgi:hypothetical protein